MAENLLTLVAVAKAKPADKPVKMRDGGGLFLEVRPTGAKWWRWRYFFAGKEKMLSLGTFPAVGLADVRRRRDQCRAILASGIDPSAQRQADKQSALEQQHADRLAQAGEPLPGTFEAVAREWLTHVHQVKASAGHAQRTRVRLEQDVFPWIGALPVSEVTAPELLACLRRVVDRGAVETAHRIKVACGQVFRYAISTGKGDSNPAADLREALPPVVTRHLAAIVDPDQAAKLLRDVDGYVGHPVTRAALQLSALLLLRPGELRQLQWAWVDLDGAQVTVPSALMKRKKQEKANGLPHLVPLAPQAVAILRDLAPLTGSTPFVFPSQTSPTQRCMSENTVRSALRRMGYGNQDMTAHGFRAMARTMADERLGVSVDVIEAQLAHAVPDALGRAYNRTLRLAQRRDLMARWADYLDQLRAPPSPADAGTA